MAAKRSSNKEVEIGTSSSEKNCAVKISINNLPTELLLNIFSKLPFSDRQNARLVCQLWYQLSYDFTLIQNDVTLPHNNINLIYNPSPCSEHINIRLLMNYIDTKSLYKMTNCVDFWQNHCQNLRSIGFVGKCTAFLLFIKNFLFFPRLEHITLAIENDCFYEGSFPKLFTKRVQLLKLRSLTLLGNSYFLVEMLKIALFKAPKLESVFLDFYEDRVSSKCAKVSLNLDFTPIANLKEIYFKGSKINDFIEGMADIFGTKLERLTLLKGVRNELSFTALEGIVNRCFNLKHLVLDRIPCSQSSPLLPFRGLNFLTTISLGYSRELTDDLVASLAVLNNLAHFDMRCTSNLTSRGISEVFGRRVRPEMVELRLKDVSLLSENCDIMVEITPKLPNLKVLYLSSCKITKNSLQSLMTHNPSIQCLTLNGTFKKSRPYRPLTINRMNHLIHLDIFRINIPSRIIGELILPSLQFFFCKSYHKIPEVTGWPLIVEDNSCYYSRNNYFLLYNTLYLTCCKSPFVNNIIKV